MIVAAVLATLALAVEEASIPHPIISITQIPEAMPSSQKDYPTATLVRSFKIHVA